MKVTVVGGGAWGSALGCVSARAGHETVLWCRKSEHAAEIDQRSTNKTYLGDLKLEPSLSATDDMEAALFGAELVLFAVPAQSLGSVLKQCHGLSGSAFLVTTCKGIDRETGKLPAEIIREAFSASALCALSGPSFAVDVVAKLPTAVTIASEDIGHADKVAELLSGGSFRCYSNEDLQGVELGGALKNVLALAVGAARGMGLGASAEAALIARGFAEITRLAVAMGARAETLMGLSGLGDMTLTCSSTQSRNFSYGMAMGRGESLEGLRLAEGAFTASAALRLAKELDVDVPITKAVVSVLEKQVTAREAVSQLLTRPLKRET